MDSFSKHQSYVTDRLLVFEEKFKKVTKDTFEMTKDVKRDFNNCLVVNEGLKSELTAMIAKT